MTRDLTTINVADRCKRFFSIGATITLISVELLIHVTIKQCCFSVLSFLKSNKVDSNSTLNTIEIKTGLIPMIWVT